MIGSLFKDQGSERRSDAGCDPPDGNSAGADAGTSAYAAAAAAAASPDEALLSAFPVIAGIARRKMSGRAWNDEAADLVQRVFAKLLAWRAGKPEKSAAMSAEEWSAYAARTTFNEANDMLAARRSQKASPESEDVLARLSDPRASVEGNSPAEVESLALALWSEIGSMTLRQRRAVLLSDVTLIAELVVIGAKSQHAGVTEREMMDAVGLDGQDWIDVVGRLPLTDGDIAELEVPDDGGKKFTVVSIRKARFEARKKLWEVTRK